MHEQIDALLNLFRQRWRTLRTITVHADWLWLNAAELNTLLAPAAANGPNTAAIAVDDAALAKLLDEPLKTDPHIARTMPRSPATTAKPSIPKVVGKAWP